MANLFLPAKSEDVKKSKEPLRPEVPGGYRVQFSDRALADLEALPSDLQTRILNKIKKSSTTNPAKEGTQEGGIPDRIRMSEHEVSALVWISSGVRVLTVVQIANERSITERT
ncbi:type II toxin-antitoxin system RelE family toxin [Rhodococcus qingshengii]|uniref:type II toxin-antitoxin system RelE family toxin n=1 Tax=Rhodococcus qingshengii TaxID=334542 RepID=UPI0035DEEE0F